MTNPNDTRRCCATCAHHLERRGCLHHNLHYYCGIHQTRQGKNVHMKPLDCCHEYQAK